MLCSKFHKVTRFCYENMISIVGSVPFVMRYRWGGGVGEGEVRWEISLAQIKRSSRHIMKNALMICSEITEPGGVTAQALFPSKNSSASRRNFTSDGR